MNATENATDRSADTPFDCHAAVLRLWDHLDGELEDADRTRIDAHLAVCDECPPHFLFERRFLDAVRAARMEPGASDALRVRVIDLLLQERKQ